VNGIVESLTAWLVEHTYAVVFVSSLVDATAFPFPGRIILAAAGAFAAAGDASLTLVIALGTAGVIITDHAWYFAGSLGSNRLLRLYCRLTFSSADCVERTADWFKRFGPLVILVGRHPRTRVADGPRARRQLPHVPRHRDPGRLAVDGGLGRGRLAARRALGPGLVRGALGRCRARGRRRARVLRLPALAPRARYKADGKRGARFSRIAWSPSRTSSPMKVSISSAID
jgi:membrane protein YqaA with SNARE-associated domain